MDQHRTQQDWDLHFMKEAKLWMSMSKCLSRKVGAIVVKNNHIVSAGYNGPPKSVLNCDYRDDTGAYTDHFVSSICPRQRMGYKSGEGLNYCVAVHGEINPILQAAVLGTSIQGATLYCYCDLPCIACSKEIINSGIKRIVCLGLSEYQNSVSSYELLKKGGVSVDIIDKRELVDWKLVAWSIAFEGSIGLGKGEKRQDGDDEYYAYNVFVSISNTNKELLDAFCKEIGFGNTHLHDKHLTNNNWKPLYHWVVNSYSDCLYVCERILPYLPYKQEQASLMVDYCKRRIEITSPHNYSRKGRTFNEVDDAFYAEFKRLNARGNPEIK